MGCEWCNGTGYMTTDGKRVRCWICDELDGNEYWDEWTELTEPYEPSPYDGTYSEE
jgi:hypothetical protein